MGSLHRLRTLLTLFIGLLLPLEQAHCALSPLVPQPAASVATVASHPDADPDACCAEPEAPHHQTSPEDPCCSIGVQILAVSPTGAIQLIAPRALPELHGITPLVALDAVARRVLVLGFTPDERSGSPPEPYFRLHSLRGPPHSA